MHRVETVSQLFKAKVFEKNNTFLILIFFGRDRMIDGSSNLVNVLSYNSSSIFQKLITVECPGKVGFACWIHVR